MSRACGVLWRITEPAAVCTMKSLCLHTWKVHFSVSFLQLSLPRGARIHGSKFVAKTQSCSTLSDDTAVVGLCVPVRVARMVPVCITRTKHSTTHNTTQQKHHNRKNWKKSTSFRATQPPCYQNYNQNRNPLEPTDCSNNMLPRVNRDPPLGKSDQLYEKQQQDRQVSGSSRIPFDRSRSRCPEAEFQWVGKHNLAQNTGPTDQLVDQEKDGKMTSTNS